MPNNLTDNEIVKSLKIHTGRSDATCKECIFYGQDYCRLKIAEAALDLINRQKAEIEKLKLIVDKERADRMYLSQSNKAIIAGQETLQKALAEKNAEIERLKAELSSRKSLEKIAKAEYTLLSAYFQPKIVRAEAVKEFAERLKEEFAEMYFAYEAAQFNEVFDNLVKEMVGESK